MWQWASGLAGMLLAFSVPGMAEETPAAAQESVPSESQYDYATSGNYYFCLVDKETDQTVVKRARLSLRVDPSSITCSPEAPPKILETLPKALEEHLEGIFGTGSLTTTLTTTISLHSETNPEEPDHYTVTTAGAVEVVPLLGFFGRTSNGTRVEREGRSSTVFIANPSWDERVGRSDEHFVFASPVLPKGWDEWMTRGARWESEGLTSQTMTTWRSAVGRAKLLHKWRGGPSSVKGRITPDGEVEILPSSHPVEDGMMEITFSREDLAQTLHVDWEWNVRLKKKTKFWRKLRSGGSWEANPSQPAERVEDAALKLRRRKKKAAKSKS